MSEEWNSSYEFGPFRLIPKERQLLRHGQPVALPPKAFDTLVILVERNGHVVTKEDLIQTVWPDAFVEENNINQYISLLRKILADGNHGNRYIETVRGYGYRFAAAISVPRDQQTPLLHQKRTLTHVSVREEVREQLTQTQVEWDSSSGLYRDRFSSRQKFAAGIFISTALLASVAIATFFLRSPESSRTQPAPPGIHSVAVLPFRPLGPKNSDDEYLGISMADALITKLGQIKKLEVRATRVIQKYEFDARQPTQIGRELNVDAVIDGRFQKSGDEIRVTVQLVNARDNSLLWTGQFDRKVTELLAVQDSISEQAAQAMKLQLTPPEAERLARRPTTNAQAYQAYLKGRYYWNKRTLIGFNKAIENFQQAIDLDPTFALAYGGLADCYNLLSEYNIASLEVSFVAAEHAARKALELDESLAEAHTSLAYVLVNYKWDWVGGEKEYRRAVELKPSYATAHQWYAEFLSNMGRVDEAQAELSRALELDPLSPIINAEQGLPLLISGQYDQAIEKFRKAIALDPDFAVAHAYLSMAYEFNGQTEQSAEEKLTTARLSGLNSEALAALQKVHACCGLRGLWKQDLEYQLGRRRANCFSAYMIAQTYARLNDNEQALRWLEQAYKEHDRYVIGVKGDHCFTALRSDSRFLDLLKRLNFSA